MRILTSVIGSYPARNLEEAIDAQIEAGIDVVTDGQTSGDMIQIFASKIPGIIKCNEKYEIRGELAWPASGITVQDQNHARNHLSMRKSPALLKGIVTGPYTLAKACVNNYYGSEKDAALALARVLNSELRELQGVVDAVQIDEPAFYFGVPDYANNLFAELTRGIKKELILHAHANKYSDLQNEVRKVAALPVHVLSYDFAAVPRVRYAIAKCAPKQYISLGCVRTDVSGKLRAYNIANRIKSAVGRFGEGKIKYVTPDCGLRSKTPSTANEIMRRVVAARDLCLEE